MKKILFYLIVFILFAACEKTVLNEISELNQTEELKSSLIKVINVPDDFSTIQEAVKHATNGTTIYVTGTYKEFIRIENLTDIKLIGKDAVIKLPDVDYYYTFVVLKNCKNFQFKGFTIDGDDSNMTSFDPSKSRGYNAISCTNSSGKIESNILKNMVAHWSPDGNGNVILIGSDDYNRSIFIINNKISNFFFLGIASWGNSLLHIEGNDIVCSTENKYTKSSCINPMGGSAVIKNNTIYGCPNPQDVHEYWTPDLNWGMVGLDINDTRNTLISNNVIKNCNPGLFLGDFPSEFALESVKVINNQFYNNTVDIQYYKCTEDDIILGHNTFD